jgi:hypothetical protein
MNKWLTAFLLVAFCCLVAKGQQQSEFWKRSEIVDPMTDKQVLAYQLASDDKSERAGMLTFYCDKGKARVLLTAAIPWFETYYFMGSPLYVHGNKLSEYDIRVGSEKQFPGWRSEMYADMKTLDVTKQHKGNEPSRWIDAGTVRFVVHDGGHNARFIEFLTANPPKEIHSECGL